MEKSSLYLHVPFCKHLCNYCDFYKRKLTDKDSFSGFETHLLDSFHYLQSFLDKEKRSIMGLRTLYLGGGTPSLWGVRGAEFLKKNILNIWPLEKEAEFTLEVDPDSYQKEDLLAFKEIGVNRFSVGMQSFDDEFLVILDRRHRKNQIIKLLEDLNELEVDFTVDFLIGVPFSQEKKRDILKELSEVFAFDPVHLSLYILSTRANYPHKAHLPEDEYIEKEYLAISEFLKTKGFEHYEISNFAKEQKYSRHNLAYWKHQEVLSLGSNATGLIHLGEKRLRYQWKSSDANWTEEFLDKEAIQLEKLFLEMRTMWGLELEDHFREADILKIEKLFERFIQEKLMQKKQNSYILTPRGYLIQDSLMDEIFKLTI